MEPGVARSGNATDAAQAPLEGSLFLESTEVNGIVPAWLLGTSPEGSAEGREGSQATGAT